MPRGTFILACLISLMLVAAAPEFLRTVTRAPVASSPVTAASRKPLALHKNRDVPIDPFDSSVYVKFFKTLRDFKHQGGAVQAGGCQTSLYGCCSDGSTPRFAKDSDTGCPASTTTGGCGSSFGCCSDGITGATGAGGLGCPVFPSCSGSANGCCPDGRTAASGPNGAGCGATQPACNSQYGCCPDGQTAKISATDDCTKPLCSTSEFGCCTDGKTPATGAGGAGCTLVTSTGGCGSSFGCCPDGKTAASNAQMDGCPSTSGSDPATAGNTPSGAHDNGQSASTCGPFKCCPGTTIAALGPNWTGCFAGGCSRSPLGCCDDYKTPKSATEPFCPPTSCKESVYGCCSDGGTTKTSADGKNCPVATGGCDSEFGCCADGVSGATGPDEAGCALFPPCSASPFGCCRDGRTACSAEGGGQSCENTAPGCGTAFGCCPDGKTGANSADPATAGCGGKGPAGAGLAEKVIADAAAAAAAAAGDASGSGIDDLINNDNGPGSPGVWTAGGLLEPNLGITADPLPECVKAAHGCCPDGVSSRDFYSTVGCPPALGCGSIYGCCPDGVTAALDALFGNCPQNGGDYTSIQARQAASDAVTSRQLEILENAVAMLSAPKDQGYGPPNLHLVMHSSDPVKLQIDKNSHGQDQTVIVAPSRPGVDSNGLVDLVAHPEQNMGIY